MITKYAGNRLSEQLHNESKTDQHGSARNTRNVSENKLECLSAWVPVRQLAALRTSLQIVDASLAVFVVTSLKSDVDDAPFAVLAVDFALQCQMFVALLCNRLLRKDRDC